LESAALSYVTRMPNKYVQKKRDRLISNKREYLFFLKNL
jgi:hypothetical protein